MTYRKSALEFRKNAVALVQSSERPIADIARFLGISDRTLWYWVAETRKEDARWKAPSELSIAE
jgi:transposase-like protein